MSHLLDKGVVDVRDADVLERADAASQTVEKLLDPMAFGKDGRHCQALFLPSVFRKGKDLLGKTTWRNGPQLQTAQELEPFRHKPDETLP